MNQKRVRFSETMVLIVFGILLLVNAGAALADIKLPAVISDNMVLQRNKKVSTRKTSSTHLHEFD